MSWEFNWICKLKIAARWIFFLCLLARDRLLSNSRLRFRWGLTGGL